MANAHGALTPNTLWTLSTGSQITTLQQTGGSLRISFAFTLGAAETFSIFSSDAPGSLVNVTVTSGSTAATFSYSLPVYTGLRGSCLAARFASNGTIAASYCAPVVVGTPRAVLGTSSVNAGSPLSVSLSVVDANNNTISIADQIYFVKITPNTAWTSSPALSPAGNSGFYGIRLSSASASAYQFTIPFPGRYRLEIHGSNNSATPYATYSIDVLAPSTGNVPSSFLPDWTTSRWGPARCAAGAVCAEVQTWVYDATTLYPPPSSTPFTISLATDSPAVLTVDATISASITGNGWLSIPVTVGSNAVIGSIYNVTVRLCICCVAA